MVLIGEVQVFQKQRDRQTEHAYSQKSKEYKIRKIYIFRVMKKEGRNFMSEQEVVWRHGSEKRWQS